MSKVSKRCVSPSSVPAAGRGIGKVPVGASESKTAALESSRFREGETGSPSKRQSVKEALSRFQRIAFQIFLHLFGGVLDVFFHVAVGLLNLALSFAGVAFGFLFGAADHAASVLLHFTSDFLHLAFDLVFVHGMYLSGSYGKFHVFKLTPCAAGRRKDAAPIAVGGRLQGSSGAALQGMGVNFLSRINGIPVD
jgi:hypothetical protein